MALGRRENRRRRFSRSRSFFGFVKKNHETDEKQPFFGLEEGESHSAESDRFRRTEKVGFPIPPNGEFFGFGPTDARLPVG